MKSWEQYGIALFGLSALAMALSNFPAARQWAPIVGLVGQFFWTAYAWKSRAWGIAMLVPAYAAVYAWGVWVQWFR